MMFDNLQISYNWSLVFENDVDAYIPEIWAMEGLMLLESNIVYPFLVHRDFEDEIAQFGDVVNTRKPASMVGRRRLNTGNVFTQDATATNVAVPLNQWVHTSFMLGDADLSKSMKDLVQEFLRPAVLGMGKSINQTLAAQTYHFLVNPDNENNTVGKIGQTITQQTVTDARQKLMENEAPDERMQLAIPPVVENALLNIDNFTTADKIIEGGRALRTANIGRIMGFDVFMTQQQPSVNGTLDVTSTTVNNSAGYAVGSTTITIDGTTPTPLAGEWFTVAGDMVPHFITAASATSLTFTPGLVYAVSDGAAVTIYNSAAINNTAGYPIDYPLGYTIDSLTNSPKMGQMVTTGESLATRNTYGIATVAPSATEIWLDRPTATALSDGDVVGMGPAGNYSLAFHPNAFAFISRPLATPPPGTGAVSGSVNYQNLSMRATISYDAQRQGTRVTLDMLCGVQILDKLLATVILS